MEIHLAVIQTGRHGKAKMQVFATLLLVCLENEKLRNLVCTCVHRLLWKPYKYAYFSILPEILLAVLIPQSQILHKALQ
jgi:hypothetical protein